jgi:hypothetical protein
MTEVWASHATHADRASAVDTTARWTRLGTPPSDPRHTSPPPRPRPTHARHAAPPTTHPRFAVALVRRYGSGALYVFVFLLLYYVVRSIESRPMRSKRPLPASLWGPKT